MRAFDRIVDSRFRIVHRNGATLSNAEKRTDILATPVVAKDSLFAIADDEVVTFGDLAISRGTIGELKSAVFYTNPYEHEADGWHVVAPQLTRVPRQ